MYPNVLNFMWFKPYSQASMSTKSTTPAPSFLQVYTQVRRNRMKQSFLRQINKYVQNLMRLP